MALFPKKQKSIYIKQQEIKLLFQYQIGSNQNLIRIDNQNGENTISKQFIKGFIVFDDQQKYKWKEDENYKGFTLNKSDNEIQIGNLYEKDKKVQNLSHSEIYNLNLEKQIQPKRQLLQFPDDQTQQMPNVSYLRYNNNKPFMSGAQSHNSGQFHGFPHIKSGVKKNSQTIQKHLIQENQINEGINNKLQLIKMPLHTANRTINSPNNQYTVLNKNNTNKNDQVKVSNFPNESKNYITTDVNTLNNTFINQNISYQSQSNDELIQYCDIPDNNQNIQNSDNEADHILQLQNSPLHMNIQNPKSHSVNQQRKPESHFIELNKKKLKYIGMKKKTAYDQIVDSILKQHDIREKDEKKAAQKEKRKKFQQAFKQNIQNNNQCSINNHFNQQITHNLNTTIGSDFENCFKSSGIPSPEGRGAITSFKNKTNEDFKFQIYGTANKNKVKKSQSPYQQYLEKQIESETKRQNSNRFQKQNTSINSKNGQCANENIKQDDTIETLINNQYNISYQQQQQISFKRKMKNMIRPGNRSRQLTIEDYINSEQLKQKLLQSQWQNNTMQNYYHKHQKNNSKLMNSSFLRNNVTLDQIEMTQNVSKQAKQIKKLIDNINENGKLKNINKNTDQKFIDCQKWNELENEQKKANTISTIQTEDRAKDTKQKSTGQLLVDEDLFTVNHKPRYVHDRNDSNTQMNFYTSKKRIKSQNSTRINSNDYTDHANKYNKSPVFYNEIQPWDTVEQNQFDDEDICVHSKS